MKIINHKTAILIVLGLSLTACASAPVPPPVWDNHASEKEASEYAPYATTGTGIVTGQAFLTQKGGGVVVAAGHEVILDPVTPTSIEWWQKAGKLYALKEITHPSTNFQKARKTVIADGSGKFTFNNLPTGRYFVRTILTWEVPFHGIQGGVLGDIVEVQNEQTSNVILNHYAPDYHERH